MMEQKAHFIPITTQIVSELLQHTLKDKDVKMEIESRVNAASEMIEERALTLTRLSNSRVELRHVESECQLIYRGKHIVDGLQIVPNEMPCTCDPCSLTTEK